MKMKALLLLLLEQWVDSMSPKKTSMQRKKKKRKRQWNQWTKDCLPDCVTAFAGVGGSSSSPQQMVVVAVWQ
jgi:hypothetical protein